MSDIDPTHRSSRQTPRVAVITPTPKRVTPHRDNVGGAKDDIAHGLGANKRTKTGQTLQSCASGVNTLQRGGSMIRCEIPGQNPEQR
jgi:hypothetical protein